MKKRGNGLRTWEFRYYEPLPEGSLIAMLLQLQDTSDRQKTNETNLRDEILRLLTTSVRQRSGHQCKGTAAEGM